MSENVFSKEMKHSALTGQAFLFFIYLRSFKPFFGRSRGTEIETFFKKVKLILFRVSTGHFGMPNLSRYNTEVFPVWGRATQTFRHIASWDKMDKQNRKKAMTWNQSTAIGWDSSLDKAKRCGVCGVGRKGRWGNEKGAAPGIHYNEHCVKQEGRTLANPRVKITRPNSQTDPPEQPGPNKRPFLQQRDTCKVAMKAILKSW